MSVTAETGVGGGQAHRVSGELFGVAPVDLAHLGDAQPRDRGSPPGAGPHAS